jgi:hypothetical protein
MTAANSQVLLCFFVMMMRFTLLAAIALGSAEARCFVSPDADGHASAEALQASSGARSDINADPFT